MAEHPLAPLLKRPDGWFATADAVRHAKAIAGLQRRDGGWAGDWPEYSTLDDGATTTETRFLARIAVPGGGTTLRDAVKRGVECILAAQIRLEGTLLAWCQQHDERTLAPAPGRSFEPVALASAESVGIVRFLLGEEPTPAVTAAVEAAAAWLTRVRLPGGRWARFYEIGSDRPVFRGRDGVVRYRIEEIDAERRAGYAWFTDRPSRLLSRDLPRWRLRGTEPAASAGRRARSDDMPTSFGGTSGPL